MESTVTGPPALGNLNAEPALKRSGRVYVSDWHEERPAGLVTGERAAGGYCTEKGGGEVLAGLRATANARQTRKPSDRRAETSDEPTHGEMPLAGGDNNGTLNDRPYRKYSPLTKCLWK
jgi:hypothetical protein